MTTLSDKEKLQARRDEGFTRIIPKPLTDKAARWLLGNKDVELHRDFFLAKTPDAVYYRAKYGGQPLLRLDDANINKIALSSYKYFDSLYEAWPSNQVLTIFTDGKHTHSFTWTILNVKKGKKIKHEYILYDDNGKIVLNSTIDPETNAKSVLIQLFNNSLIRPANMTEVFDGIYNDRIYSYRYDQTNFEIIGTGKGRFTTTNVKGTATPWLKFNNSKLKVNLCLRDIPIDRIIPKLISDGLFKPQTPLPPSDLFPDFVNCLNLR